MPPRRILLADDHTLVRQGLRKILESQPGWVVVGEAGDGRDAVQQTMDLQPDVVIMDIAMPQLNGVEAVQQIERRNPSARVLVLSMYSDEAYVTRAVRAGAAGYLLKDSADVDLIQAVSAVSEGKSFFSPAVARVLLDEYVRQLAERGIADRFDTSPSASGKSFSSSPRATATKKWPPCCTSARRRSRPTGRTSWEKPTCTARRTSCCARSQGHRAQRPRMSRVSRAHATPAPSPPAVSRQWPFLRVFHWERPLHITPLR
jgi:DNA-binding NarL/FixJ family response regulator